MVAVAMAVSEGWCSTDLLLVSTSRDLDTMSPFYVVRPISGAKFEICGSRPQPIVRLRLLLIDDREHLVALLIKIDGGSQWHFVRLSLNRPHDLSGNCAGAHGVLILLRSLTTAS